MTQFAEHQFDTPCRERPARPWWEGGRMWEAMSFGRCEDPIRAKVYVGVSRVYSNGSAKPASVGLNCLEHGHASSNLTPEEARRVASFLLQAADFVEAENRDPRNFAPLDLHVQHTGGQE